MRWWRKPEAAVEVGEKEYAQWLQSGRPPFEWFMRQDALTRTALARLGEDDRYELLTEFAKVIVEMIAPGASEGDPDAQMKQAQQVAASLLNDMREKDKPKAPSMAGLGERRARSGIEKLFGRKPQNGGPDGEPVADGPTAEA